MASDDRVIITVQVPQSAPAPLVNIIDSSMNKAISQRSEIEEERIPQIPKSLSRAHRHQKQSLVTKNPYIYRAPHLLREVNTRAYEPNVISIGPYHHVKKRLQRMEAIKLNCFIDILKDDDSVANEILRKMKNLEKKVRQCYEEPSSLSSGKFVEMMVYDGCFIIHLFLGNHPDIEKYLFNQRGIVDDIANDLLLLENQLPFFVLSELYHIITKGDGQLVSKALTFFDSQFDGYTVPEKDFKHLLDLVHSCSHPSTPGIEKHKKFKKEKPPQRNKFCYPRFLKKKKTSQPSTTHICSATELDDAGIDFFGDTLEKMKKLERGIETTFDIEFIEDTKVRWIPILTDTKVLMIPTLKVQDWTERTLRNYIAYEQFNPSNEPAYFSDYVSVMDNLISTSKDVQLLCKKGIIDNWLGDDEAVANLFNGLRDYVFISDDFYYAETFERMNKHCQGKWHKWMASLNKNYFNSPWSFISFLAATALVVLTIVQTIFSVLSHFDDQN